MKIKRMLKVIIICMGIIFITSCQNNKGIYILSNGTQKELLKNYISIKNHDVEVLDNDAYLTLNKINEKVLIDIILILQLKIELLKDNIVNVNTTRTVEGGPFLRNYLKITTENGIEIVKDTESPIRLIYDPTHPDAIREGEKKGYVEFPNVDITTEYHDLIETVQLYNGIVDFTKKNYKQIIIEKINIMTVEEMQHDVKIEKMLELLLRYSFEKSINNK
jgi:flagellar basal body rod protein FlgC